MPFISCLAALVRPSIMMVKRVVMPDTTCFITDIGEQACSLLALRLVIVGFCR